MDSSNSEPNAATSQENVMTISLKLPQFWADQPRVWFTQAEAQFAIRHITADATKFHYVVGALDQEVASRIIDLLEDPPATDKYETLKKRLIETYVLSDFERAGRLLHLPCLGDEKPSLLMDKMLNLLGKHNPDFLFKRIFIENLPEEIQADVAQSSIKDPRELAKMADVSWAAKKLTTCAINRNTKQYQKDMCFYHSKFGDKAYKCQKPCKFAGKPLALNPNANQ